MRIVFFGTPDFAVPSLNAIVHAGYEVAGVVTAPDKPAGRGLHLHESAVKKYAVSKGLPLLQPEKMKADDFQEALRSWKADIQIVIAFRMMPEIVWQMPPKGTFNLHASLLPRYRGAAPINRAIMNGDNETGLTTFFLKHEIDTGNIILQKKLRIGDNETAGQLHDRMMLAGADLVVETLDLIVKGKYILTEQGSVEDAPHAPKIFKEDCRINWMNDVKHTYNVIRGLSPHPTAYCLYKGDTFKIYEAEYEKAIHDEQPGTFVMEKHRIKIACQGGYIYPMKIQAQGKKNMDIQSFIQGFRPDVNRFE